MSVIRFLINMISTVGAILAGNWLGGQFRSVLIQRPVQTIHFVHETATGLKMDNYPVGTKFYPALICAFLAKPRWLVGFLAGTFTGLMVDDRYEVYWLERVIVPFINNVTRAGEIGSPPQS